MNRRVMTEEQLIKLMTQIGERWHQQAFPPMTPEQEARALKSVNRVLDEISACPRLSPREKIAALLSMAAERLRSVGVMSGEGLAWAPATAGAGKEEPAGWSQVVSSDDGRIVGTLLVTDEGEVWVGFETRDPTLSDVQVAFALVRTADQQPLHKGHVTLKPAGKGVWEGRERLSWQQTLNIETDCELVFGLEETQE